MLPIYAVKRKISAIIFVWISKNRRIQIERVDKLEKIPTILKIIALLFPIALEIQAVKTPAKAETTAIKDKIRADLFTP